MDSVPSFPYPLFESNFSRKRRKRPKNLVDEFSFPYLFFIYIGFFRCSYVRTIQLTCYNVQVLLKKGKSSIDIVVASSPLNKKTTIVRKCDNQSVHYDLIFSIYARNPYINKKTTQKIILFWQSNHYIATIIFQFVLISFWCRYFSAIKFLTYITWHGFIY